MPFFSIIIPTYNRAVQIVQALQSLLNQEFKDFEIVVVDDGSEDNTQLVVEKFSQQYSFIKYEKQINKGVCAARNTGAKLADGNYLLFLDSDDAVDKRWLSDFYELLNKEKYDVVFCNMKEINEGGNVKWVDASNPYQNIKKKGKYIAGMFAIRAELFNEVGMYDELIKYGENTELGIRLRMREVSMGFVNQYNFIYNKSEGEGNKNNINKLNSNIYIVNKHPEYFKKNPVTKKLFIQVAAVAAARLGMHNKANELFKGLLKENKKDLKLWLQYLITLNRVLTKLKWHG